MNEKEHVWKMTSKRCQGRAGQCPLDAGSLCILSRIGKLFKGFEHVKGMSPSNFFLSPFKRLLWLFNEKYTIGSKCIIKEKKAIVVMLSDGKLSRFLYSE